MGGSGLGLAIVKHALQRHDATLSVESEEGSGSTFTCHFPADRVVAASAGRRCSAAAASVAASRRAVTRRHRLVISSAGRKARLPLPQSRRCNERVPPLHCNLSVTTRPYNARTTDVATNR